MIWLEPLLVVLGFALHAAVTVIVWFPRWVLVFRARLRCRFHLPFSSLSRVRQYRSPPLTHLLFLLPQYLQCRVMMVWWFRMGSQSLRLESPESLVLRVLQWDKRSFSISPS